MITAINDMSHVEAAPRGDTFDRGATAGGVAAMLRIEGAIALAGSVLAYRATGGGWPLFAVLFLLPDLSMLGYLANPRIGSTLYNAGHTYIAVAVLAAISWGLNLPWLVGPALIWSAHIGFDRMMGYGLKYAEAFGATHLGWRGKRVSAEKVR